MLKFSFCKKPKTKVKQRPETKWYLWTHLSAQLLYNTIHGLCHSRIITYAVQMEQAIWFSVYSDMCSTCIFQQCNTWTFTVCFIQQWYLGNIWLINFEDDVFFFFFALHFLVTSHLNPYRTTSCSAVPNNSRFPGKDAGESVQLLKLTLTCANLAGSTRKLSLRRKKQQNTNNRISLLYRCNT